jgi:hypothetical protein
LMDDVDKQIQQFWENTEYGTQEESTNGSSDQGTA